MYIFLFTVSFPETGKLYSFGEGSNGQLGHGTTVLGTETPRQVTFPVKGVKVIRAVCGENHSAIVTGDVRISFSCYQHYTTCLERPPVLEDHIFLA